MNEQNKSVELMLNSYPLIGFSKYTHTQVKVLEKLGDDILEILDTSMKGNEIKGEWYPVYGKFWLWVLGAYEVVRTMTDTKTGAHDCFSERVKLLLAPLKVHLAEIRMPFAKQQIKGKNQGISGETSIAVIDQLNSDFGFDIGDKRIFVRGLISEFQTVFSSISRSDVLNDLRDAKPSSRKG